MASSDAAGSEDSFDRILSSGGSDLDKSRQLLALFPTLPKDRQTDAAQILSRLLPDDHYQPLGQYLANPATPQPVLDVLLANLMSRPDEIKVPWLAQVARNGQNPVAAEAAALLKASLGAEKNQAMAAPE